MKKVLKYFLYVCFSPKGRINRAWFWIYVMASTFLWFGLFFSIFGNRGDVPDFKFLVFMYTHLGLIYPSIVVCVKRLHDTDRSGWNMLWVLIPTLGVLYIIIVCGFFKGTDGGNRYGELSALIGDWDSYTTKHRHRNL